MIADKLPSPGNNVAQNRGSMEDYYSELNKAAEPARVPIPSVKKEIQNQGEKRAEMTRIREAIQDRVETQGKKGYDEFRSKVN